MPGRRLTPRPRWTPGQRRALERSHSAGKLEAVSAQKVGRSASAVKAKIARLGLSRNPADPRQGDLMAGGTGADPNTESSSREDDHAEAHHRQRSSCRPGTAGSTSRVIPHRAHAASEPGTGSHRVGGLIGFRVLVSLRSPSGAADGWRVCS